MSLPPTIIPAKQRVRRKRQQAAAPLGPPIDVADVTTDDPAEPGKCHWDFDGPVTLTGLPLGLRVLVGGVWLNPIAAVQVGPQDVYCTYDTTQTLDLKQYDIIAAPSGIAEAGRIVLPQDGIVGAP